MDIFTDLPASTHTFTTTVEGPPIYYTITPRDELGVESSSPAIPLSRATPRTLQTITEVPAMASSIDTHEKEPRDYVLYLSPISSYTSVISGKTYVRYPSLGFNI